MSTGQSFVRLAAMPRGNGRRLDLVHRRRSDPRPGYANSNNSECDLLSATHKRLCDSSIACSIQESEEVSSTLIQRKRGPVEFFGSFYRDQHSEAFFVGISILFWLDKPLPDFLIHRTRSVKPSSAIEAQTKLRLLTGRHLYRSAL